MQIVTDAIDRLHTTAESHDRVMVVEVMGRHAGWIATHAGIAGGADAILVPERPFDIEEVVRPPATPPRSGAAASRSSSSPRAPTPREGTAGQDPSRRRRPPTPSATRASAGSASRSSARSRRRTGFETRVTILGHVQRGGTPVAFDRVLATRFGVAAMEAVAAGRFGVMVALRGTAIVEVPLAEALREPRSCSTPSCTRRPSCSSAERAGAASAAAEPKTVAPGTTGAYVVSPGILGTWPDALAAPSP